MSALNALSALGLGIGLLSMLGCSGTSGNTPAPTPSVYDVNWSFNRLSASGLDSIEVTFNLLKDSASNSTDNINLTIKNPDGSVINRDDIQDRGDGEYFFSIYPDQTGEYQIDLTYAGATYTQTPIVLDNIAPGWQQPMSVQGLVNTPGFEGGAHITRDGQWLFIQYAPVSASSNLFFNSAAGCNGTLVGCDDPLINKTTDVLSFLSVFGLNVIRPAFPEGRLSSAFEVAEGDNTSVATINHNAAIFSENAGNPANTFRPPSAFYGFKRLDDGRYSSAFTLAIGDGNEGVLDAQGLSITLDSAGNPLPVFSFIDPSENDISELNDNHYDIYTGGIILGGSSYFSNYIRSENTIIQNLAGAAQNLNFEDHAGTQANPYLFQKDAETDSIWTDTYGNMLNANDTGDINVYTVNDSGYQAVKSLPLKINTADIQSQAFFTGDNLLYREAAANQEYGNIKQVEFNAGSYDAASSWLSPKDLITTNNSDTQVGSIVTLGDPSIGFIDGKEVLFFSYGKIRERTIDSFLNIDMQVGYLEKEVTP